MRLLDRASSEAEIRDLWSALWDALVPASGPVDTVQGQLMRAQGNLSNEYYRNGMMNYYSSCLEPSPDSYAEQLDFLVETLLPDDREYLARTKARILEDRKHVPEAYALQEKRDESGLSEAEEARFEALCVFKEWEELFDRTERLVLNYCIGHPLPQFSALLGCDDEAAGVPTDAPGWLGLQVTWSSSGLRVDGVHPASPAVNKLRPGDVIARIDGQPTATLDGAGWAMKLLAGPQGSTAFLRVGDRLVKVVRGATR
jgi:hypothetical protein